MWDSDSKNRDTSLSALQMWLSGAWLRIHSSAKGLWMMPSSGISFVICWQVWSVSDCGTQQRKKFIHNCRPLFIYQSSFFTQFKIIGRKVSNHFSCKYLVYHRIPLRQLDDLRCSSLKIKRNLTPFAVVVHLIQVDSGGDFLMGRIDPVECVGVSRQRNGNVRNINHPLCGGATYVIQKITFPL